MARMPSSLSLDTRPLRQMSADPEPHPVQDGEERKREMAEARGPGEEFRWCEGLEIVC